MEVDLNDDSSVFTAEQIEPIVSKILETHLSGTLYNEAFVDDWVNKICEDSIAALAALEKPFKYVVTCVLMQSTGAGMHAAVSEFVDGANDGTCVVRWPVADKDKGGSGGGVDKGNISCVTTVFGIAV